MVCGEAADGLEAVEKARVLGPDVVLMDVSLPQLDGVEAARTIRRERPATNVIIVSQSDPRLLSRQAADVGARGFVSKSDLARSLLQTIAKVVDEQISRPADAGARQNSPAGAIHAAEPHGQPIDLLAAIVDSSDDAIISKNLDGVVTSWNKSAERIFGYTAGEAIGQEITLIVPPERRNEEAELLERLRRGERINRFQTVRRAKDGARISVSLTISPVRNGAGRAIGASTVARDVTAQRRAVQALQESEERFRAMVETNPECVNVVAVDGTLLHMNSGGVRVLGGNPDEVVVGKCVYDMISEQDRDTFRAFNERVCAGEKGSLEFEVIGFDGRRRQMETHAAPMRNTDGTMVQLAVTRDVSARKQAEERERHLLAQSVAATAKFRAVFEQTSVFAGILNNDGIVLEVNKLCLEGCGYRADQVLGRAFWDTPWWREFKESRDKIRAATPLAAQGVPYRGVLHYSWADGTRRIVEFALYPILDDEGRVCFLHPTGVDITVLKNTEESYRRLTQTLDAQVQARTREVEARNAEVLKQAAQLRELSWRLLQTQDDERRHIARELHDSAGQTLTVMGMDLAQLIEKAERLAPELMPDAQVVEQSLRQLQQEIRTTSYLLHPPLLDDIGLASALSWYVGGLAERTSLGISLDIAEDFGRLPREMELVVFRTVQECLTNIHRHSGSKTASIRIARHPDRITVAVEDCGNGMSRETLKRLRSGGSGVGVAGMHERLRQFGGTLCVDSDSSGTQIRMEIPIPTGSAAAVDAAQPVRDPDVAPRKKSRARKSAKRAPSAR
jgi:PAS domain S-box-containing protein